MLKPKKQGLFFGSGFSYEFGMPSIWELTKELRNYLTPKKLRTLNQSWRNQGGGHCDEVIQKVIKLLENDNIHYEDILGSLEVDANRYENRHIRTSLQHIKNQLLDLIFWLLHQRQVKNKHYIQTSIEMHKGLKSLISAKHPLWVFSLNHDLIIEIISAEFNIPLKNGFSDETISLSFDLLGHAKARFKVLDINNELTYPYNYFKSNESGINLLKMHGSLDFFGYDDLRRLLCLVPEKNTLSGYIDVLNLLVKNYPDAIFHVPNEFVVLDNQGQIQFLRKSILSGTHKFQDNYIHTQIVPKMLLDLFKSSLNYIDELIVIGYGFGDIHINLILREWLEFTSCRSIIIINPKQSETPSFIRHLHTQVTIQKMQSNEYFSSLPGGELTLNELFIREVRRVRTF